MKRENFFIVSAIALNIAAGLTYDWKLLDGSSNPNVASWAVWSFITILNFKSYKDMSKDWKKSAFPLASSILCLITLALVALKGRFAGLNYFDITALVLGSVTSIAWWLVKAAKMATVAQVLSQICIAIGFIPTYIMMWNNPHAEQLLPWIIWPVSFAVQAYVVKLREGKFFEFLYPVNCVFLHSAVAVMILVL